MAEPTNPGQPSSSATERGTPVNVNTSGNVTVTRKDVATGDVKSAQEDLLKELCKCIDNQTDTLGSIIEGAKKDIVKAVGGGGGSGSGSGSGSGDDKKDKSREKRDKDNTNKIVKNLKKIADEIKAVIAKPGGGGGDSGKDSGSDSAIAAQAHKEIYDELAKVMKSNVLEFSKWGRLFKKGAGVEITRNIGNVNKSLLDFGQRLTDVSSAWRKASGDAMSILEIGQGGMIDVTSLLTDLGSSIISNRDALQASAKTVIEFREQNMLLIGTLGDNLEEVSEAFKRNRDAVDAAFGEDFLGKIPFDEQNVILADLLESQKRAGIKSETGTILQSQASRSQLQFLQEISYQTGQTVKEVMKLYKEEAKTYNTLEALGLLKEGEGAKAGMSAKRLRDGGQGAMVDTITEIITAGSIGQWMKKNDSNAVFASQGNNTQLLEEAVNQFVLGTAESSDNITELGKQLKNVEMGGSMGAGGILAAYPELQQLATLRQDAQARGDDSSYADVEAAAKRQADSTSGKIGATIASTYNDVREFMANNFGATGDLVLALTANTGAVIWNTLSRKGITGGGMADTAGKAGKGLWNKAKGLGNAAKTAGGAALTGIGASTVAAAVAAGVGIWQGGQAITSAFEPGGSRSDINDALNSIAPNVMETLGNGVFGGIDRVAALFGSDSAQERIDAQNKYKDMKLAEEESRAKSALARKNGLSPVKGVAPATAGDMATVAPSEVTSSTVTPLNTPSNAELVKQTNQLDQLIQLTIAGNVARTDTLNAINKSGGPETGRISAPKGRYGRNTPSNAFSPLLAGANE